MNFALPARDSNFNDGITCFDDDLGRRRGSLPDQYDLAQDPLFVEVGGVNAPAVSVSNMGPIEGDGSTLAYLITFDLDASSP